VNLAFDGDYLSSWSSGGASGSSGSPLTVTVDLGRIYPITQFVLYWTGNRGTDYTIQVSSDNSNWSLASTRLAGVNDSQLLDQFGPLNITARWVQVAITNSANAGSPIQISEFEIYGPNDFGSQYISTFVTNKLTITPATQKFAGTISKFAVVKVNSATTAGAIATTGNVAAQYCPIVNTNKVVLLGHTIRNLLHFPRTTSPTTITPASHNLFAREPLHKQKQKPSHTLLHTSSQISSTTQLKKLPNKKVKAHTNKSTYVKAVTQRHIVYVVNPKPAVKSSFKNN